jgi:hypothetical protein
MAPRNQQTDRPNETLTPADRLLDELARKGLGFAVRQGRSEDRPLHPHDPRSTILAATDLQVRPPGPV